VSLANLLRTAKAKQRLATSLGCIQAGPDAGLGIQCDVRLEFCGELAFVISPGQRAAEAPPGCGDFRSQGTHALSAYAPSAGVRKRERISVACSHSAAAFRTCL
jgi:hypothetical protein